MILFYNSCYLLANTLCYVEWHSVPGTRLIEHDDKQFEEIKQMSTVRDLSINASISLGKVIYLVISEK